MSKTNIIFSASSLDLFMLCHYRYKLGHLNKLTVPMAEKSKSLDFGGLSHIGFEKYFKMLAQGHHYNDRMQETLLSIRAAASDPEKSNVNIIDELPIVLKAVEESCDYWRHEDEQFEVLAVEEPFDFIMHEDDYVRVIISGKIDLLVNKPATPGSSAYEGMPIDHKTYKREFPTDSMNVQFPTYCAAVNSSYLLVNKVGLQATLKPHEKFKRIPLSYDHLQIEQWKQDILDVIYAEYFPAITQNIWTRNKTSCRKFGRLCEFYSVCNASGEAAKEFNLSNFVKKQDWDKYKDSEAE